MNLNLDFRRTNILDCNAHLKRHLGQIGVRVGVEDFADDVAQAQLPILGSVGFAEVPGLASNQMDFDCREIKHARRQVHASEIFWAPKLLDVSSQVLLEIGLDVFGVFGKAAGKVLAEVAVTKSVRVRLHPICTHLNEPHVVTVDDIHLHSGWKIRSRRERRGR